PAPPRPVDAGAARPAGRLADRLLPGADRDRRGVQLRRLLALPRTARLHVRGVACGGARPRLSAPVLEVAEDVADRLGTDRALRVPAGVLPRTLGDVHPLVGADRAVPDELPAARARLEGDPRRPGSGQLVPVLDRPALAEPPALAAALQPLRRHAR